MKNGNVPAMPTKGALNRETDEAWAYQVGEDDEFQFVGLSKREHFAGLAMQNIINRYNPWEYGDFDSSEYEIVAENAVGLADALLKELDK